MNEWIIKESAPLTQAEMENNVSLMWNFFGSLGWTANAVSALAGNVEAESTVNPGRWEGDNVGNLGGGFGLVQWTPATKIRNWIVETYGNDDYTNGVYQLNRIVYESETPGTQWFSTNAYPLSFKDFTTSEQSPGYLAVVFLLNYERPADQSTSVQNYRASLAEKWYTYITGLPAPAYCRIPIWLLFKFKRGLLP